MGAGKPKQNRYAHKGTRRNDKERKHMYNKDENNKEKVITLRKENYSYNKIAETLGMKKNTVQSICQRAGVKPVSNNLTDKNSEALYCRYCHQPFGNVWNRKGKVFCSDSCRTKWWNEKRKLGNR